MVDTMRSMLAPVVVLFALASCSTPSAPVSKCADEPTAPGAASWAPAPAAPTAATAESPNATSDVSFEIADAPLVGAAELIQKRMNERIEIDVLAMPTATCTRVNVKLRGRAKIGEVLDALEASLGGTGLKLVRGRGSHQIVRAGEPSTHRSSDCTIREEAYHQWVIAGIKKLDPTTVEIKRAHLKLWSEEFFRFYPSTEDPPRGKTGFILTDRHNFETPAAVGAQKGDLVVAIQGEPLGWRADVSAISRKVASADTITIDIVRGGKPLKLTLKVVP